MRFPIFFRGARDAHSLSKKNNSLDCINNKSSSNNNFYILIDFSLIFFFQKITSPSEVLGCSYKSPFAISMVCFSQNPGSVWIISDDGDNAAAEMMLLMVKTMMAIVKMMTIVMMMLIVMMVLIVMMMLIVMMLILIVMTMMMMMVM